MLSAATLNTVLSSRKSIPVTHRRCRCRVRHTLFTDTNDSVVVTRGHLEDGATRYLGRDPLVSDKSIASAIAHASAIARP